MGYRGRKMGVEVGSREGQTGDEPAPNRTFTGWSGVALVRDSRGGDQVWSPD